MEIDLTNNTPVLLSRIGRPESHTLSDYRADGGYEGLAGVLRDMKPEDLIQLIKDSSLRGRGGAGFPTGLKWSLEIEDHPGPYRRLNADESEPGTFNNRILMEEDPHQVIEGLILACYATRSVTAYYYMRYEYPRAWERLLENAGRMLFRGYTRQIGARIGLLFGYLSSSRCGGIYLWRRDRTD